MDKRIDLAVAAAVAAFGVFLFVSAQRIPHGSIDDPLQESGLPALLGILFAVGGATLVVRRLLVWRRSEGNLVSLEGAGDVPNVPASAARAFTLWGSTVAYVVLLPRLGFLIATPLYLVGVMTLMGLRSWVKAAVATVSVTVVLYLLFTMLFGIRLPRWSLF